MGKKYTADTFEGAVTGTASGNVAKTGDTMTGTLTNTASNTTTRINNTNAQTGAGMLSFQADSGSGSSIVDKFVFSRGGSSGQQAAIKFEEGSGTYADNFIKFELSEPNTYNSTEYLTLQHSSVTSSNRYIKASQPVIAQDGIYLGTTTKSSANHLDDYEEGSYNVQFFVNNNYYGASNWVSGGGQVWTDNSQYIKVGRKVTLFFDLQYKGIPSAISSYTGSLYLSNLPFTMAHGGGGNISFGWYNRNTSTNANPQDLGGATRLTGNNSNQSTHIKLEHPEYSSYWGAWFTDSMPTNYLPTVPPGGNINMLGQFTYFTDN